MSQPNGNHECSASGEIADSVSSEDGLGTEVSHCGMILPVNLNGGAPAPLNHCADRHMRETPHRKAKGSVANKVGNHRREGVDYPPNLAVVGRKTWQERHDLKRTGYTQINAPIKLHLEYDRMTVGELSNILRH